MNTTDAPSNAPKSAQTTIAQPQKTAMNAPVAVVSHSAESYDPAMIAKPSQMIDTAHSFSASVTTQPSLNLAKNEAVKPAKPAAPKTVEKSKMKQNDVKKITVKHSSATHAATTSKKSDNVVAITPSAATGMFTANADKVVKSVKDTMSVAGIDGIKKIAETADRASRLLNESMCIGRDHMEACVEASTIAAECTTKLSENMMNYVNDAVTESVEISKSFFGCRKATDLFALQSKLARSNVQRFFDESSRASDMLFRMASQASEPFTGKLSDVKERVNKALKQ